MRALPLRRLGEIGEVGGPMASVRELVRRIRSASGLKVVSVPELDPRLAGPERLFRAPPLNQELIAALKLISTHCDFPAADKYRSILGRRTRMRLARASIKRYPLTFARYRTLVKLTKAEKLDLRSLADEFGVNLRTIQRDPNARFAYLPLDMADGRNHLDPAYLGKLSTRDIERFAALAGIRGLFPSLSDDFLRDMFDTRMQEALLVKGHHYENLAGKEQLFRKIEKAIVARN